MDVMKLLEYLQDIIETSNKIPMTNKVMVDKKEILDVVDKIINNLPDEFKKAQWVYEEKERILSEAMAQSDSIKKENMEILRRQIENHDVCREAQLKAEQIVAQAQRESKDMRLCSRDYADEVLSQLNTELEASMVQMLENMKKQFQDFFNDVDKIVSDASGEIRTNIKELRDYNK